MYAVIVEVVLLGLVIWYAWKWPRSTPSVWADRTSR